MDAGRSAQGKVELPIVSPHPLGKKDWFLVDGTGERIHMLFNVIKIIRTILSFDKDESGL